MESEIGDEGLRVCFPCRTGMLWSSLVCTNAAQVPAGLGQGCPAGISNRGIRFVSQDLCVCDAAKLLWRLRNSCKILKVLTVAI